VKGLADVTFYEYHNHFWCAFGVENKSREDVELEINCGKSDNCLASVSARDMKGEMRVKAMKSKIGMFLTPVNPSKEWVVRCSVAI
jgi:hypothetical protein